MTDITPTIIKKNMVAEFGRLLAKRQTSQNMIADKVRDIIDRVKMGGDEALLAQGQEFDNIPSSVDTISALWLTPDEKYLSALPKEEQQSLALSVKRVEDFHQRLFDHYGLAKELMMEDKDSAQLGIKWSPIDRVGIYVPGGLSAYPSSVIMNALPAKVAGVKDIIMACPLGLAPAMKNSTEEFLLNNHVNSMVMAAAYLVGVKSVLCLGGAGAISALAFGTATCGAVDKIVGPGNEFVAEAKRQVFGKVGIDIIAGPSEVLVLADDTIQDTKNLDDKAEYIAFDLISQAEHDKKAMAVLITDSDMLADKVVAMVAKILSAPSNDADILQKQQIAKSSWCDYGAVVVVDDLMTTGVDLANHMASEHVEVLTGDDDTLKKSIRHAGAIFMGAMTPEAFGDYLAGPSHVLPTFQSAKFSSGLSVFDFMKRTSIIKGSQKTIQKLGDDIARLAMAEKLPHHAQSVLVRMKK